MLKRASGFITIVFACLGIKLCYDYLMPIPFIVCILSLGYYFKCHLEQKGENEFLKNVILYQQEKINNYQKMSNNELEFMHDIVQSFDENSNMK